MSIKCTVYKYTPYSLSCQMRFSEGVEKDFGSLPRAGSASDSILQMLHEELPHEPGCQRHGADRRDGEQRVHLVWKLR